MSPVYTIISEGYDSDYNIIAIVRWLSEQTPEDARKEFILEHGQKSYYDIERVLPWLITKGFCEEIRAKEINLGYGNFCKNSWPALGETK